MRPGLLPGEITEWILSFDRFEPVTPIAFDLVLPGTSVEEPLRAAA